MKPQLRIQEFEAYQGIYCGLCRELGRQYGLLARMTLSYDFAFLAALSMALEGKQILFAPCRCLAHPLRRRSSCCHNPSLEYSAAVAMLLVYHKLRDNLRDGRWWERAGARLALALLGRPCRRAARQQPQLAGRIEREMERQSQLEREHCSSVDAACEPTANCMAAIFAQLSQDPGNSRVLERLGYLMGRWVYLVDALDDFEDDFKTGSYNPFWEAAGREEGRARQIRREAVASLHLTTGEIGSAYNLLDLRALDGILENIIFLGLNAQVLRLGGPVSQPDNPVSQLGNPVDRQGSPMDR